MCVSTSPGMKNSLEINNRGKAFNDSVSCSLSSFQSHVLLTVIALVTHPSPVYSSLTVLSLPVIKRSGNKADCLLGKTELCVKMAGAETTSDDREEEVPQSAETK